MKKLLTITLLFLCVFTTAVMAQSEPASPSTTQSAKQAKRGPVFRATKEQINRAQALLKSRGFYAGEQIGKLDDATREGLRKYQQAEGLKVTGTLNKVTLEKMNIALTDKQKTM
ncbi:MAG TPA: peptidoglycan-binding domain-containing protein [Pyrinomonadaceae bacterium]|nr:peptidoglycan-binding domain-containing protein [Pyrinomonadaceae bacterium]